MILHPRLPSHVQRRGHRLVPGMSSVDHFADVLANHGLAGSAGKWHELEPTRPPHSEIRQCVREYLLLDLGWQIREPWLDRNSWRGYWSHRVIWQCRLSLYWEHGRRGVDSRLHRHLWLESWRRRHWRSTYERSRCINGRLSGTWHYWLNCGLTWNTRRSGTHHLTGSVGPRWLIASLRELTGCTSLATSSCGTAGCGLTLIVLVLVVTGLRVLTIAIISNEPSQRIPSRTSLA